MHWLSPRAPAISWERAGCMHQLFANWTIMKLIVLVSHQSWLDHLIETFSYGNEAERKLEFEIIMELVCQFQNRWFNYYPIGDELSSSLWVLLGIDHYCIVSYRGQRNFLMTFWDTWASIVILVEYRDVDVSKEFSASYPTPVTL